MRAKTSFKVSQIRIKEIMNPELEPPAIRKVDISNSKGLTGILDLLGGKDIGVHDAGTVLRSISQICSEDEMLHEREVSSIIFRAEY